MHICHVITRLIVGGAQENTLLTCAGLHADGYRVSLLSGPTCGPEGSLVSQARQAGYEFVEIPTLRRAINPWYDARAERDLFDEFRRIRPDIVHTHSSKAGILGRRAAVRAGVPRIVHTIHGMSFNRTQPPLVRWLYARLERRCARHTDALVAVADALVAQTVAARVAPQSKLRTIYSGMAIEAFTPSRYDRSAVRAAWGVSPDELVIGTIARLFRQKGYEQLIPIMSALATQLPEARFVWVGDGAQRRQYEAELLRRGLLHRTVLTGLVPPDELPAQLAGFDILAHTSQWEGLPRVVVQALLMQVPVVAFSIDGTPEVVQDGRTGRLVDLGDEAGFVAAILELAGDPARRAALGRAGRELCRERFDWRVMVRRLEELYEELRSRPVLRT